MLADVKQFAVAVGVGPEPSFGAVVAGAVLAPARQVPERYRDIFTRQPFPIGPVGRVAHQTEPVLTARIVPTVPPPQFPTDEPLERRIGLVDERPSASLAKLPGFVEIERLVVVKQVAIAVVRGAAARLLIPELRAPLNGQSLLTKRTDGPW